jgi:YVTN family beta-propeller protein
MALRPRPIEPGERVPGASSFGTDVFGLPDGSALTPDAAPRSRVIDLDPGLVEAPWLRPSGAVALATDGRWLALLTSGFNRAFDADGARIEAASGEYVFVYDLSDGGTPRPTTVLRVANTFGGLAFGSGGELYVGGGPDDDVEVFLPATQQGPWRPAGPPLRLGHLEARTGLGGIGRNEGPFSAGLAIAGSQLVVADDENDALSIVDMSRPEHPVVDVAVGEYPFAVAVARGHAFVSTLRGREVVDVSLAGSPSVTRRISVGEQPTALASNRAGDRLYVANAGSDAVSIVDTAGGAVLATVPTLAPAGTIPPSLASLRGSNPNGLALSPDERTLYVTNGGNNTMAVVALDPTGSHGHVAGLIPTGFYPSAVRTSPDGRWLYVAHAKSPPQPNPRGPWTDASLASRSPYAHQGGNEHVLQQLHGGLLAVPVPDAATLDRLTEQAIANDFPVDPGRPPPPFDRLSQLVKHVVFVVGENRTYDQILGDLAGADGDARLVHWGQAITPNHHALARRFVALDRFFATGDVSGDGWQWTMGARTTDVAEKAIPLKYAERGHHTYDWEGMNRGVNVGLADDDARLAFDPHTPLGILPGTVDVATPDALLWDAAIAAGKSVRVYGTFVDLSRYGYAETDPARIPLLRMPFDSRTRVAFPAHPSLQSVLDPYFRGFDQRFPDTWRQAEWKRELDDYVRAGDLPALSIVRLPRDHLGDFAEAVDGVDTPDTQIADHDWALGRLVDDLSRTPFWDSTVVIALEDDAQNGSDHVDSHRTLALLAGGHVRRGAVVHTPYTTTSALRTIELLLGLAPLGQHDAEAAPMGDVFDLRADDAPFDAIVPDVLRSTQLPLPPRRTGEQASSPRGDAAWWAAATAGFDFEQPDAAPTAAMNRVLECGLFDASGCSSGRRR